MIKFTVSIKETRDYPRSEFRDGTGRTLAKSFSRQVLPRTGEMINIGNVLIPVFRVTHVLEAEIDSPFAIHVTAGMQQVHFEALTRDKTWSLT